MQKNTIALLTGALFLAVAGTVVVPGLLGEDEIPVVRWAASDEVEVALEAPDTESVDPSAAGMDRTEVEVGEARFVNDDRRIALILRGRVIDKYKAPVADATVWLGYSRSRGRPGGPGGFGGTQRRIPDPVHTDDEGRFAFQGETFRNLRVSLQVAHTKFAPGSFDHDLGEVTAEVDLGDHVLNTGGEAIGRVTDLEGNGIAAAQVELGPQGRTAWQWMRSREQLLPPMETDLNGYYRMQNVPGGDWVVSATAHRHTEGRSATFAVEEEQQAQVDDIRLGPGFEVTGYVRDTRSQPIAGARVTLRSTGRDRSQPGENGRGGRGQRGGRDTFGMGRTHTTQTDDKGRFFLEHLPGVTMRLEVRADGYLTHDQEELDPKLEQPVNVTLEDGLRIAGTVLDDADGQPVTTFAVVASQVRGLPIPGFENVDFGELMQQMRDGNLDDAARERIRSQMQTLRSQAGNFGGGRDRGRGPGGDPRQGRGGMPEPEPHPDGVFVVTGLQEGIYEVSVRSPDHAFYRSAEVEVRHGSGPPTLTIRLDRGHFYAGLVVDADGVPVPNAQVELRVAGELDAMRRGRPGRDQGARPDFGAIGLQLQRAAAGTNVRLEAKTDASGEFIFTHVPKGNYSVRAEADGYARSDDLEVELLADRSDGKIELDNLGRIIGTVRGLREEDAGNARVAAIQLGDGQGGGGFGGMGRGFGRGMQRADVAADGSYALENLAAGNYLVRAWVGEQQDIIRQLMPMFLAGELQPDVKVKGGETAKLDLTATRAQLGDVAGSVQHNGEPGKGLRVSLTQVGDSADNGGGGGPGRGGRGGRGGFMRGMQQATVGSTGSFTIERVPEGQYTLSVATDNGTILHQEQIFVVTDQTTERHLSVISSALRGTATAEGVPSADIDGSIMLLPGATAIPDDLREWRRTPGNTAINGRVRDGKFEFETIPTGGYLMVLSVRGRERSSAQVFVGAGENETSIAAGAVAPEGATGGQPGARQPGGGRQPGGSARRGG